MITSEIVKIYKRYKGDADMFARIGRASERAAFGDLGWAVIDSLIQDIELVQKGVTSKQFSDELENRLKTECENGEVVAMLRRLAGS